MGEHDEKIEKVHVSKDNKIVVTTSSSEIKVWEIDNSNKYIEKVSIEINEDDVNIMALSEEGHLLAYTGKE